MISPWRKSRWRWAEATHSTPGVERPRSVGTWSERVEAAGATGAFYLDTCGRLGRRDERAQVALRYTSRSLVSAPAVHHRVSRWRRTCRRWRGALLSRSRGGANGTKNPVGCHFWRANEEGSKLFRRTITRALTHVEVGVELLVPCPLTGRVRASALPAGQVAMTVHWGLYSKLGEAHQAVIDWCATQGKRTVGTRWEVYGPHNDDPAKVWTEVYYLLK